jgi:DNA-binding NtrC family response regulator
VSEILGIEDEPVLARNLARALEGAGHATRVCASGESGVAAAETTVPDLVLLDLRLPDGSGLDVLARILDASPAVRVVIMTAYGSVKDAVEAMRRGAVDYLQKPLDLEELRLLVDRVLEQQRRDRELDYLRTRDRALPRGMVGEAPQLREIFEQVERLREACLPPGKRPTILLTGESGTGKGVVAREIHEILGGGPFIDVNCVAMPASLIEAELFGHERGSFTDAKIARTGLFEAAEGGTLFLDEIGDLELGMQVKFLKAIEEKRVRRLGATRDREINVHVIAATNRDLDAAATSGQLREDLLYRLRVLSFEIPPLRERRQDIRQLAAHFCHEFSQLYGGRGEHRLSEQAEAELESYAWPGNVRELRNVMERVVLLSPKGSIERDGIARTLRPAAHVAQPAPTARTASARFVLPREGIRLEDLERELLVQALGLAEGNRSKAAKLLGLSRDTLRYRLEKFGIGRS